MTQDEKKICLLQLISEEPYIVWLSFMVNKCKMISFFLKKNGFYFSKILIFWVVRRVKGQKMAENDIKICLTPCPRNCISYDCGFWYTCVKWWYLQHFFFPFFSFFKILIFRVFQSSSIMLKGNSEVCPTFFTRVRFHFFKI